VTLAPRDYASGPRAGASVATGADAVARTALAAATLTNAVRDGGTTGTWRWIQASFDEVSTDRRPWLVTVGTADALDAVAVLVDDDSGSVRRTFLAGTEERHRGCLTARDDDSAALLGIALADALMDGVREFTIGPVRPGPAVDALLARIPVGVLVEEVAVPLVRLDQPHGMSRGTERTLRKAANRLAADGVEARVDVVDAASEILMMLPTLESIFRDRDHASGRTSALDDPARRRLWQRRVRAAAATGSLRLATLWLDDELAAFVLAIDDRPTLRILDGRYVGRWARYAPGRILEAAVLEAAAGRPAYDVFDWMTDIAPETLLAANDVEHLVVVRGRS